MSSAKQNAILGAWIPAATVLTQHMLGNKSRDGLNKADTDIINDVAAFIGSNGLFLVQFLKIENKKKKNRWEQKTVGGLIYIFFTFPL